MSHFRVVLAATASNPNVGDLYLDDSGQLELIGGDLADQDDYSRMVLQRIRGRLLLVRGEWYLDQRIGTPWKERVWIKGVNENMVRRVIQEVVESTPGVERLDEISVSIDSQTRTATITLTATSDLRTVVSTSMLDEPFVMEIPIG